MNYPINKKRLRILVFCFLCLFLLNSCEKLNEHIISGVTESYYANEDGFEAGVNAAYVTARGFYGTEQGAALSVFGTDIWTKGGGGANVDINDYTTALGPQENYIGLVWTNLFQGINGINTVIASAGQIDMNPDLKSKRLAEMRFLRALYYFNLVRTFGSVPLDTIGTESVNTIVERAPVLDVYKQIISDLNFADAILPLLADQWGRATRGAAEMLLSNVYLQRAYISKDQADFQKAAFLAEKLINSGQYNLLNKYADIFDIKNQKNEEVIWSVQYGTNPLVNGLGNMNHLFFLMQYDQLPGMKRTIEEGRPWIRFEPTNFLLNLFNKEEDSRYSGSFQTVWLSNNSLTIPKDANGNPGFAVGDTAIWLPGYEVTDAFRKGKPFTIITPSQYTAHYYPSLTKFKDPARSSINQAGGTKDFIVLRLAETYLIAAEAEYQLGNLIDAAKYINAVRKRAANIGFELNMMVDPNEINLDFILDERARELAGEGKRWFDLVRTGQLILRVQAHNPDGGPFIKPYHVLRPIPTSEIDAASNKVEQNPGY